MKTLFITVIFLCVCSVAKSQNIYYTPFIEGTPHQPQQRTQKIRSTAYHVDNNGKYIKLPIQVTVTTYIHPAGNTTQEIKVTSYYRDTGLGGQWENIPYSGVPVQQCQSILGDQMEQSFMFKVQLYLIDLCGGWFYFDL